MQNCLMASLKKCLGAGRTHLSQQVEGRWLIESHAGDPIWPGECHVQGDATTVGVADESDFLLALVDAGDRPGRLVGEGEAAYGNRLSPEIRQRAQPI